MAIFALTATLPPREQSLCVTFSICAIFLACAMSMTSNQQPVTIAIVNGVVWTGEPNQPWAEAIALSGDHIAAVGSASQIRSQVSKHTRVIDAHGGMVTPGFIDSHVHFLSGGMNLASVQLRDARTPAEFIS